VNSVSTNYRELAASEVAQVDAECANAWMDPDIPQRQYDLVVAHELERWLSGERIAPFDALMRCMERLPFLTVPSLLDVGASSGYYREVLSIADYNVDYTGLDFSPAFQQLAQRLYPDMVFKVGDARALPFSDDLFEIILHSAVLMHCAEYKIAISEAARVASQYVIFHRTPIVLFHSPTKYWLKQAYDVPCIEIWFNEAELFALFAANNLKLTHKEDIFISAADGYGHRSYLLQKT
jgi:Methylase involved in ubiquinone/menaquinone biosynthesis